MSHYGWVIISPAVATSMAEAGQLGQCVPDMVGEGDSTKFRLREDMGNPHFAAWLRNEILPMADCGSVFYSTEHLGDAVEAMLGLCVIMEAVFVFLRE